MTIRNTTLGASIAGAAIAGFALAAGAAEHGAEHGMDDAQRGGAAAAQEAERPDERTPPVGANRPPAHEREIQPNARATPGEYVVEKGDTLAEIAQSELGDAKQWRQIASLNGIDDPKELQIGTRLRLPQRGEQAGPSGSMGSEPIEPRAKTGEDPAGPPSANPAAEAR